MKRESLARSLASLELVIAAAGAALGGAGSPGEVKSMTSSTDPDRDPDLLKLGAPRFVPDKLVLWFSSARPSSS